MQPRPGRFLEEPPSSAGPLAVWLEELARRPENRGALVHLEVQPARAARYGELTGFAPLPPLWSFGVWMSRCMYVARPQVEEVVETARELGIPMDVIHVDPRWLKARNPIESRSWSIA